MKKIVSLISLMFAVALTACNNDSDIESVDLKSGEKLVTLSFGMNSDYAPITRGSSNLADFLGYLKVYFYNNSTKEVQKTISQTSDKSGFGTMSVGLSNASYNIWAAGTTSNPTITNNKILSYPDDIVEDTFAGFGGINVNTQDDYTMTLKRVVAKVGLVFTDANIPANVTKIRITHNGYTRYDLEAGSYDNTSNTDHILEFSTDKVNNEFYFLVFSYPQTNANEANAEKIQFTVDALDNNNVVIESKSFENVPVRPNYATTYTGSFYADKYFSFSIDTTDDWSTVNYDKTF